MSDVLQVIQKYTSIWVIYALNAGMRCLDEDVSCRCAGTEHAFQFSNSSPVEIATFIMSWAIYAVPLSLYVYRNIKCCNLFRIRTVVAFGRTVWMSSKRSAVASAFACLDITVSLLEVTADVA